jgi:hypothetical protein
VLLPEEIDHAGKQLIDVVDEEKLPAQAGIWAHSPQKGWKYLLITPDIEMVQGRLPDLFRSGRISQAKLLDDVKVDHPGNYVSSFCSSPR